MTLPRKAQRLLDHLERLQAPGSGASEAEVAFAARAVERLLARHGLKPGTVAPAPAPEPAAPKAPRRLLTAGSAPAKGRTSRTRRKARPAPERPREAPLRILPPVAILPAAAEDWALALGATVAEACGARLVASDGPRGTLCLAFAGAGADPEVASASWGALHALTEGRSHRWCRGFAAAVDERLDATIQASSERVARVAAWLDGDPLTTTGGAAPLLDTDDDEACEGAEAGRAVAL